MNLKQYLEDTSKSLRHYKLKYSRGYSFSKIPFFKLGQIGPQALYVKNALNLRSQIRSYFHSDVKLHKKIYLPQIALNQFHVFVIKTLCFSFELCWLI